MEDDECLLVLRMSELGRVGGALLSVAKNVHETHRMIRRRSPPSDAFPAFGVRLLAVRSPLRPNSPSRLPPPDSRRLTAPALYRYRHLREIRFNGGVNIHFFKCSKPVGLGEQKQETGEHQCTKTQTKDLSKASHCVILP